MKRNRILAVLAVNLLLAPQLPAQDHPVGLSGIQPELENTLADLLRTFLKHR